VNKPKRDLLATEMRDHVQIRFATVNARPLACTYSNNTVA